MGGWALGECGAIYWLLRKATGWDLVNASADCFALKKTTLGRMRGDRPVTGIMFMFALGPVIISNNPVKGRSVLAVSI
jgi:hypothetical protein